MKERGITLIALIITIILLIILAAVSINIVYKNSMIDIAVNGAKDYVEVAQKEQEEMNDLSNFLDVAKNRRPYLNVNIREIGETFCIIEAKAKDEDGGKLTYKLYFGASRDNLEEKEEKKEEQGTKVEWNVTGLTEGATYYYKVEVKDEYETVESGVREVVIKKNKAPVITKVELVSKESNSISVKAQATDEDGDKLVYKLYYGKEEKKLALVAASEETNEGIEIILNATGIANPSGYYYKIEVTDGELTAEETKRGVVEVGKVVDKPNDNWTSTKITPIADGEGGTVALPEGYYYIGGDIKEGFVVSDKEGDTLNASGVNSGNQFVWIPVPDESYLERTVFDDNGKPIGSMSSNYIEPYTNGYPGEVEEYNTMKAQVIKYGGFYIGRYEAGVNTTTLRTAVTTAQEVVSKKGVAPYNYATWGESLNDIGTTGAVYLAKNKYSHPDSVTSTLCYGCQWDAMCRYIGDSQRKTPTKPAPELTGSVSSDVSKNIFDLAGNCCEWTMTKVGTFARDMCGGSFYHFYSVSDHVGYHPAEINSIQSFRLSFYIK